MGGMGDVGSGDFGGGGSNNSSLAAAEVVFIQVLKHLEYERSQEVCICIWYHYRNCGGDSLQLLIYILSSCPYVLGVLLTYMTLGSFKTLGRVPNDPWSTSPCHWVHDNPVMGFWDVVKPDRQWRLIRSDKFPSRMNEFHLWHPREDTDRPRRFRDRLVMVRFTGPQCKFSCVGVENPEWPEIVVCGL